MARKILIIATAFVVFGGISLFAAEKAKEKKAAEKADQQTKACEQPKLREGLLDQLITAYKADDKKAMGEIIKKMEQRREKMREFAKLNKWHQRAHRGDGMAGPGWQRGWQAPCGGQCFQRPCGPGAMGNWGRPDGMQRPMHKWRGGWGTPPAGRRPMRGWGCDMANPEQQSFDGPGVMEQPAEEFEHGPEMAWAHPDFDLPEDDDQTETPPPDWGW
jgi:hypothetical protein